MDFKRQWLNNKEKLVHTFGIYTATKWIASHYSLHKSYRVFQTLMGEAEYINYTDMYSRFQREEKYLDQ